VGWLCDECGLFFKKINPDTSERHDLPEERDMIPMQPTIEEIIIILHLL